jgi:integrase
MPTAKVINSQSFHDGKVVLYQLENRPRQKWLCRLKVPNGVGYLYRGTGTSDFYEARKFADDLYDELKFKIKQGQSITGRDISGLIKKFDEGYPSQAPSERWAKGVSEFLSCYAKPYFTKNKITELSDAEINKFFDWRRANSVRKTPSNSTIVSDMSKFKVFTDWCFKRGYFPRAVDFTRPRILDNRRPHFNEKDWAKLTRFLREWVKSGISKSGPIYRDRVMLTNYVLILANTGIRVGEARALKWSDIDNFVGDDEEQKIVLSVKGKTGARDVVARSVSVGDYLKRIWELRLKELGTEPAMSEHIFCHKDGLPIYSFKKGFNALIREAGVEKNSDGQRRVVYSLRHTYATFRLHEGVNAYGVAQNMGTSVKMIEAFYGHTSNRAMATELTKTRKKQRKQLPWE